MPLYLILTVLAISGLCHGQEPTKLQETCDIDSLSFSSQVASSSFESSTIGRISTSTNGIIFESTIDNTDNNFGVVARSGDFYVLQGSSAGILPTSLYLCARITHNTDNYFSLLFFGPESPSSSTFPYRFLRQSGTEIPELCNVCSNGDGPAPTAGDIIVLQKNIDSPELGCTLAPCCEGEREEACLPKPTEPNIVELCKVIIQTQEDLTTDVLKRTRQDRGPGGRNKGKMCKGRNKKGKCKGKGRGESSSSDESSNGSSEEKDCDCSGIDDLREVVTGITEACLSVIGGVVEPTE